MRAAATAQCFKGLLHACAHMQHAEMRTAKHAWLLEAGQATANAEHGAAPVQTLAVPQAAGNTSQPLRDKQARLKELSHILPDHFVSVLDLWQKWWTHPLGRAQVQLLQLRQQLRSKAGRS